MEEVARRAAATLDLTLIGSGHPRPNQPYRFLHAPCISRENFEKFPKIPYARDHYAWEELTFAPGLHRLYRPHDYDVTVTCGYPWSNWILRKGRRTSPGKTKKPAHVFITQNGDWMVQARNAEFKHFSCDGLICTNPEFFERHKNRYPSVLIPNGVDTNRFFPADKNALPARHATRAALGISDPVAPVVLVVAALIGSKKVPDAIRSAAAIPEVCLIVAGDGEQRDEVDHLGRSLMSGRFKRLTVPREQMPDLYRAADVLLHMSQDEPFGNIYVEALASGLPVVAHDTPVTRWITEGQAHLVHTSDLGGVSQALQRALADQSDAAVSARRQLAERRFSWDSIARQYCEFLQTVSEPMN